MYKFFTSNRRFKVKEEKYLLIKEIIVDQGMTEYTRYISTAVYYQAYYLLSFPCKLIQQLGSLSVTLGPTSNFESLT
jgi:hypothetical protein